jgi:hypothetical protein
MLAVGRVKAVEISRANVRGGNAAIMMVTVRRVARMSPSVPVIVARINTIFYKNWTMLRPGAKTGPPPAPRSKAA